jgi:hypothetical protein
MEGFEMKDMQMNRLRTGDDSSSMRQHSPSQKKLAIILMTIALALIGIFYFICYINGGDMRSVYEAILPYLMLGILILSLAIMRISLQK